MANCAVQICIKATNAYAKWDPVASHEFAAGMVPGTEERPPHFSWLLLFGASKAKVDRYLSERYDTVDGFPDASFPARVGRRLFSVGSDAIPAGPLAKIMAGLLRVGGPNADVTWNDVRAFIRNKRTNETEANTTIGDLA